MSSFAQHCCPPCHCAYEHMQPDMRLTLRTHLLHHNDYSSCCNTDESRLDLNCDTHHLQVANLDVCVRTAILLRHCAQHHACAAKHAWASVSQFVLKQSAYAGCSKTHHNMFMCATSNDKYEWVCRHVWVDLRQTGICLMVALSGSYQGLREPGQDRSQIGFLDVPFLVLRAQAKAR